MGGNPASDTDSDVFDLGPDAAEFRDCLLVMLRAHCYNGRIDDLRLIEEAKVALLEEPGGWGKSEIEVAARRLQLSMECLHDMIWCDKKKELYELSLR